MSRDAARPQGTDPRDVPSPDVPSPGDPVLDELALARLPKVELHVHLEGSVPAATAVALARSHGEDPARVLPFVPGADGELGYPPRYRDFAHFVRTYLAVTSQVRRPEDLQRVVHDVARTQADQRVRWTELTFTASTLVAQGWDATAMWEAVRDGLAAVPEAPAGIIVDAVRDNGPANAAETLRLAELGLSLGAPVVGIGLAGTESAATEADFTTLGPGAASLGLGLAVHAGETGTAENVRRALDLLGAQRIGHGIRAMSDRDLVDRLRAEQVVLEVCPTSNVVLGLVDDVASHPLPAMAAAGLAVTVNSDDPPFFSTSLAEELAHAARLLDLDRAGLVALQRRAATAAFAPPPVRDAVLAELASWEQSPT